MEEPNDGDMNIPKTHDDCLSLPNLGETRNEEEGCRTEKSLGKHQGNYLMGILLLGKVLSV